MWMAEVVEMNIFDLVNVVRSRTIVVGGVIDLKVKIGQLLQNNPSKYALDCCHDDIGAHYYQHVMSGHFQQADIHAMCSILNINLRILSVDGYRNYILDKSLPIHHIASHALKFFLLKDFNPNDFVFKTARFHYRHQRTIINVNAQ
jgi:hypothetical protein